MIHFVFSDSEPRYVFLKVDNKGDVGVMNALSKHINLVDPVCYLKTYTGAPFTQDFLFRYTKDVNTTIWYASIGLWHVIWKFFKDNNVPYDGLDPERFKRPLQHTYEEFVNIVSSWSLKYPPRPYQLEAAYKILCWKRSVSELATRAGKTLISYIVFRYGMVYMGIKRILMIVPSVDLVKQAYSDFKEYGEFFNTECIWGGGKLVESSNMSVGTFQSIVKFADPKSPKYNPEFFTDYDMVFVDETHRATSKSIRDIISQPFMKSVKVAFGLTGTVPKEKTIDFYCLSSLLGAVIQHIRPIQLMESGYISPIRIYQHRVKYTDTTRQLDQWIRCAEYTLGEYVYVDKKKVRNDNPQFLLTDKKVLPEAIKRAKESILCRHGSFTMPAKIEYRNLLKDIISNSPGSNMLRVEQMMMHFFPERTRYIIDVLKSCPKNTLVLATHREYIKYLYGAIKEAFPDRPVLYVISGSKDRKVVKETLASNNNCILIAGYAIMGTGITLSNLCYGLFVESYKSDVINMQSMGRGLGLSDQKDVYTLHDITDVFDKDMASNKIYLQGLSRVNIYKEQGYEYEIVNTAL